MFWIRKNDNRCHYAAYYAFNNVSAPIRQLHRIYDEMNDALIYAEGYFEILNADDETEPNGNIEGIKIKGTFDLQHVDFAYPNGTRALYDINMKIEAGKTTAFSRAKRSWKEYCNQSFV